MFDKLNRTITVPLVALAATIGIGGTALAASSHNTPAAPSAQIVTAPTQNPTDPPTAGDKADNPVDVPTAGDKADSATDVSTAGDKADAENGSEVADSDGPDGHADEVSQR